MRNENSARNHPKKTNKFEATQKKKKFIQVQKKTYTHEKIYDHMLPHEEKKSIHTHCAFENIRKQTQNTMKAVKICAASIHC